MKKLLISLGVVAMMFFAQAADVNAKTCDQKAEAYCTDALNKAAAGFAKDCCKGIACKNTSAADKATMCNKYCDSYNEAVSYDCNQEND